MAKLNQFENYDEGEIISKILSGETFLYQVIIRRYNPYLFKIGRSYGYNHQDTEDLMQETYLNAYANLNKFENRSSLKTWLVKIMLNNCYQKKQRLTYKNEIPSKIFEQENVLPMFSNSNMDTSKQILNNELSHILENALQKIPEDYRMVFSLRELNGMSTIETSEVLNISETNVKTRLNRAKNMLRDEIEKIYTPRDIYEFNLVYCDRIVYNVMSQIDQNKYSSGRS